MSRSVSAPSSVTNTSPCWNGDIVPGSTLIYGSSLISATCNPRLSSKQPIDEAANPLPRLETTPPVTKIYLGIEFFLAHVVWCSFESGAPGSGGSPDSCHRRTGPVENLPEPQPPFLQLDPKPLVNLSDLRLASPALPVLFVHTLPRLC